MSLSRVRAAGVGHRQSQSRRPLMPARGAMRASTRAWAGTCSSPKLRLGACKLAASGRADPGVSDEARRSSGSTNDQVRRASWGPQSDFCFGLAERAEAPRRDPCRRRRGSSAAGRGEYRDRSRREQIEAAADYCFDAIANNDFASRGFLIEARCRAADVGGADLVSLRRGHCRVELFSLVWLLGSQHVGLGVPHRRNASPSSAWPAARLHYRRRVVALVRTDMSTDV